MPKVDLSINPKNLEIGDIILTRSKSGFASWIIRIFTVSKYSHAAIYIGRDTIVEAVFNGVRTQNIHRWSVDLKNNCEILRCNNSRAAKIAANYCETCHGTRYSIWDAILAGLAGYLFLLYPFKSKRTKLFCSRLISESFQFAGHDITTKDPQIVRPKDIHRSNQLRPISVEYIKQPKLESTDFTLLFENATNDLIRDVIKLMKVHKIKHDGMISISNLIAISNDNQLTQGFDSNLGSTIRSSRFFSLWQNEKKANAHIWDASSYFALYKSDPLQAEHVLFQIAQMHSAKCDQFRREIAGLNALQTFKGSTFSAILQLRQDLLVSHSDALRDFTYALNFCLK